MCRGILDGDSVRLADSGCGETPNADIKIVDSALSIEYESVHNFSPMTILGAISFLSPLRCKNVGSGRTFAIEV